MTPSSDNRSKLRALLETLDLAQADAAKLLAKLSARPLSLRAVQSWLADPSHRSARSCPAWAIEMLEKHCRAQARKRSGRALSSPREDAMSHSE